MYVYVQVHARVYLKISYPLGVIHLFPYHPLSMDMEYIAILVFGFHSSQKNNRTKVNNLLADKPRE